MSNWRTFGFATPKVEDELHETVAPKPLEPRDPMSVSVTDDARPRTNLRWYEPPLYVYFMLHFFPPGPPALANICLALATAGTLWHFRATAREAFARLNQPLAWTWLLFAGLLGLSLLQTPPSLQTESIDAYLVSIGRGTLFGALLALNMDTAGSMRRLLVAGLLGCLLILGYCGFDTWRVAAVTGNVPLQRDYMYWLTVFFPFALGCYACNPRLRIPAIFAAAAIIALSVTTGFRGAMLTLIAMVLIFACFLPMKKILLSGALLALAAITSLVLLFPERASYVLNKLHQTDSSNRVTGHWLPAWDLTMQAPWTGHGFGHGVFRYYYGLNLPLYPAWTPAWSKELGWLPSSEHSIVFETLFSAGFPGLLALLGFSMAAIWLIGPLLWKMRSAFRSDPVLVFSLCALIDFVGNFLVFAQFEAPNWRTLAVLAGLMVAAARLLKNSNAGAELPA